MLASYSLREVGMNEPRMRLLLGCLSSVQLFLVLGYVPAFLWTHNTSHHFTAWEFFFSVGFLLYLAFIQIPKTFAGLISAHPWWGTFAVLVADAIVVWAAYTPPIYANVFFDLIVIANLFSPEHLSKLINEFRAR